MGKSGLAVAVAAAARVDVIKCGDTKLHSTAQHLRPAAANLPIYTPPACDCSAVHVPNLPTCQRATNLP